MTRKMGVGREDFEERREDRVERLESRVAAARGKANGASERARTMAGIMNGQPVLVGHHSEARHRRDLARMDRDMRTAVESSREADRLAAAAESAENNTAVSSDDPEVLTKLRDKLVAMEAERDEIKAINRRCRKGDADAIAEVKRRHPMWQACGDRPERGFPSYGLTNLGANIRRVKARIAELEARAGRTAREEEISGICVRENPETNRVELDIGRRATKEECRTLKSRGFKWSRMNEVWQRLANESAWCAGVELARQIGRRGLVTEPGGEA